MAEQEGTASVPTLVDLLPLDMISEISSHLDARSLCRLSQSCSALHYLSTDESIWRNQICSAYSNRWREMISETEYAELEKQFSRKSFWLGSVEKLPGLHKRIFMLLQTPASKLKRSSAAPESYHLVKLITLGSSGVGKTSLMLRYADDAYGNFMANIGVDFKIRMMEPINPKTDFGGQVEHLKVQIWDTAGQERFRSISAAYYRGVHAFILAYAVDDRHSYDEILSRWAPAVKSFGQEGARMVIVACKCDLPRDQWKVSSIEGRLLASQLGCRFVETSAKQNTNVEILYGHAATIALEFQLTKLPGPHVRPLPVVAATTSNNPTVWGRLTNWVTSSWPFNRTKVST